MMRRVAFSKALTAGAAGALGWEVSARLLILAGLPIFDLVRLLGTLLLDSAPPWQWWPVGIAMHLLIGAIWAVFYSYFVFSEFRIQPVLQGLAFSLLPAMLAGLIMLPQMGYMHPMVQSGQQPPPGLFAWNSSGWGGPFTDFLGHLIYGLILGSLYDKPVGYRPGQGPAPRSYDRARPSIGQPVSPQIEHARASPPLNRFMFATGIECSYPTIDGGRYRVDELESTNHYQYWRRDLELVRELGLHYLRYGPPLHRVFLGPGRFDWSFTDEVCHAMQQLQIVPIMDLCHFGVPDWIGNFQNPQFPEALAEYAAAFVKRYPWVRYYTPVNEMYVTARLSALDGVWNEQLRSEEAYVKATCNLARACVLTIQAIQRERPDAIIINSESSEFYQACCPDPAVVQRADFENQRRFIALDLLLAHSVRADVFCHLIDHGMSRDLYNWFMNQHVGRNVVIGLDYYEWNEKLIDSEGHPQSLGELFGWFVITRQYYERYRKPLMHTETNTQDARAAPGWLWRQWHNIQMMRESGVPVLGFTWYSLQDQVDWNRGISVAEGNVNPVGLFDLNRNPRPVAQAYRQLLMLFGNEPLLRASDVLQLPPDSYQVRES